MKTVKHPEGGYITLTSPQYRIWKNGLGHWLYCNPNKTVRGFRVNSLKDAKEHIQAELNKGK